LVSINSFFLNEGDDTIQLSMPIGNYNVLSFTQTLSTLLSSNSPNRFVYNVQSNVRTQLTLSTLGKFTYTIQNNNNNTMVSIQVGTTLFEQMGFNRNTVNYFNNSALMRTNVCTMNKESTLYLHSDMC
jgi:hypothetical protein